MDRITKKPHHGDTSAAAARTLAAAATVFNAIVAGVGVDRVVVQMPAWRSLGARPWADYSRRADLRNGMVLYPLSAICGCARSVAAAIGFVQNRHTPRAASTPILLSVVLAATGLGLTMRAAPHLQSIRHLGDDPIRLQRAFNAFDRWGRYRAVVQLAAFCANVWALVSLTDGNATDKTKTSRMGIRTGDCSS